jgi:hypothetical protein
VIPDEDLGVAFRRHELGLTLSATIAGRLMLGMTGRYLWAHDETPVPSPGGAAPTMLAETDTRGFTYDVGLTIEATPSFHLGVVAYNVRDLKTPHALRGGGAGLAFRPSPRFLAAVDVAMVFTAPDGRSNVMRQMGGAEVTILDWLAVRAGGGYDDLRKAGYASAGLSLLSVERGGADVTGAALDVGVHQDLSGQRPTTFLGIAARLFIPVPEAP